MWPSGSVDNPKSITHDVGPRSLQDEMELTSNRRNLPLCLAASYPPCSFNVACGGLVLLAAQSMSTMCSRLHAQTVGTLITKVMKDQLEIERKRQYPPIGGTKVSPLFWRRPKRYCHLSVSGSLGFEEVPRNSAIFPFNGN